MILDVLKLDQTPTSDREKNLTQECLRLRTQVADLQLQVAKLSTANDAYTAKDRANVLRLAGNIAGPLIATVDLEQQNALEEIAYTSVALAHEIIKMVDE